jgi:hypothetical protein
MKDLRSVLGRLPAREMWHEASSKLAVANFASLQCCGSIEIWHAARDTAKICTPPSRTSSGCAHARRHRRKFVVSKPFDFWRAIR